MKPAAQPLTTEPTLLIDKPDSAFLRDEAAFRVEVGVRLRMLRTWNDNLSQDELARRAGVTRNFVSAIERGTQGLDAWRLWRLAAALDVRLDVLLCQAPLLLSGTRNRP